MAKRLNPISDVLEANPTLEDRLGNSQITVAYDAEFDIFLLTIGEPQEAITEEIADGFQVRIDPDTLQILAFEIRSFRRHFLKVNPEFVRLYDLLFDEQVRRDVPKSQIRRNRGGSVSKLPDLLHSGSPRPA